MPNSDFKAIASRAIRAPYRKAARCVPVPIWRRVFCKSNICVNYHMVSDSPVPHLQHYPYLDAGEFEADVSYLKREFGFIPYDEIVRRRLSGNYARDNAATLTFDDGFAQCDTVVQPILGRHGATCIFFIITDLIDNRAMFRETQASLCIEAIRQQTLEVAETIIHDLGPDAQSLFPRPIQRLGVGDPDGGFDLRRLLLWLPQAPAALLDMLCERLGVDVQAYLAKNRPYLSVQQILQLQANGFTVGAHSCSHPRLQELSPSQAEYEIVESCRLISELTGQRSVPFAFPWSGHNLDRAWLARIRREHEFVGLYFDTQGFREDVPFVVQRISGERAPGTGSMSSVLRSAWSRRSAWHRDEYIKPGLEISGP